jgi:hypothetical protein
MHTLPRKTRERSHWALVSILTAVLLFGMFWVSQYPTYEPVPIPTQPQTDSRSNFDVSDLEASAVNINIPSFEEVL